MKIKILMVCLGNICRSPVAEGVLRALAKEKNLHMEVDSAGTSGYHHGEPPDSRTIQNAFKNGIDVSSIRSRKFTKNDFEEFDLIYVMDTENYRNVISLAKEKDHQKKVDFLLNELFPGENRSVPDPYYGGENSFEEVFQLVNMACTKIVERYK